MDKTETLGCEITEQKNINDTFQQSEEQYRTILRTTMDGFWQTDINGNLLEVNDAYCRMTGYTCEELLGMNICDIDALEDKEFLAQHIKQIIKNGSDRFETRHKCKDGKIIDCEVSVNYYNVGEERLFCFFRDITKSKETENALKKIQEYYQILMNNTILGITIISSDYKILAINTTLANSFNKPADSFIGKFCHKEFEKHSAMCSHCPGIRAIASGKVEEAETHTLTDDGRSINVRLRAFPFFDPDSKVKGFIAMVENLDDLKKTEAALRKSIERFNQVAECTGEWIWEIDKDGLYVYSNSLVEKVLGYKTEQIVGKKHFYDFFTPETMEKLKKEAPDIFNQKMVFRNFINDNIHANGSIVTLETSGVPVLDDNGNLCGYRGVDRDISCQKRAQQKQAELLEKVEKTNQELKEFAYVTSHDLKAPLRGITSLAEWISTDYGDKLGAEGKEQMTMLMGRVNRMQKLIDGILLYSRAGQMEEEKILVDLNELIPEVIDLLAPPENIEIKVINRLPVFNCEQTRIIQVFQNLLSNAVKYIDKPHGLINISCTDEGAFWKFGITDNGPGIAKEHFERIFLIFQTLSRHDDNGGTGIGLTIVKKNVELYGGRIWVESEVGTGSTFFFTLPKELEAKNEKF